MALYKELLVTKTLSGLLNYNIVIVSRERCNLIKLIYLLQVEACDPFLPPPDQLVTSVTCSHVDNVVGSKCLVKCDSNLQHTVYDGCDLPLDLIFIF